MFSCKAFSFNDLNFFPEDIHASNNLTDSGRRKYYYYLRMSYSFRSVDIKYVFVFYKMSCYYIHVNCISVNLINKTETNKTYLIKTIIIDTNLLKRLAARLYSLHTYNTLSLLSHTSYITKETIHDFRNFYFFYKKQNCNNQIRYTHECHIQSTLIYTMLNVVGDRWWLSSFR